MSRTIKPSSSELNPLIFTDPRREIFEKEMMEGYLDGFRPNSPDPSTNRSRSYRHGFANGRDDRARNPRTIAAVLRVLAEKAIDEDILQVYGYDA